MLTKQVILVSLRQSPKYVESIGSSKPIGLRKSLSNGEQHVESSKRKLKPNSWLPYHHVVCSRAPHRSCTQRWITFGPINVKVGRNKTVKHYGVVFTCMNTRAIHCEIAVYASTMELLQVLRRFF